MVSKSLKFDLVKSAETLFPRCMVGVRISATTQYQSIYVIFEQLVMFPLVCLER